MIKQRVLGRTGLKVSELCLGTLNFGWKTDETSTYAILDSYLAAGGNFIQTTSFAPQVMLPSASTSRAEELVGRWWTTRGIRREDLFLATRIHVGQPSHDDRDFVGVFSNAVQEARRRLRTHYIDMVIFEWNDGLVSLGSLLDAFDVAVRSGTARVIGGANFPVWKVVDSLSQAHRGNHNRVEALQADYSLMVRSRFEPEAMAVCQEQRLGFFASSPLAGGFLGGGRPLESMVQSPRRDRLVERFGNFYGELAQSAVSAIGARHEATSAQVALSWVLHNPAVTAAVIGVNTVGQLNELVQATSLTLSGADVDQLDHATALEEVRVARKVERGGQPEPELAIR